LIKASTKEPNKQKGGVKDFRSAISAFKKRNQGAGLTTIKEEEEIKVDTEKVKKEARDKVMSKMVIKDFKLRETAFSLKTADDREKLQ